MRVIFLDIDGVLNQCDWQEGNGCPAIHPECVKQLNKLLEATRAKIVVISNWRHQLNRGDMTPEGFAFMLRTHGVKYAKIIGATGEQRTRERHRGLMVTRWLRRHPEVTSFVVLDDLPEGREPEWVEERIVHVDGARGLTAREVRKAIELLKTPVKRVDHRGRAGLRKRPEGSSSR